MIEDLRKLEREALISKLSQALNAINFMRQKDTGRNWMSFWRVWYDILRISPWGTIQLHR